jgi:DNA polymerase-1
MNMPSRPRLFLIDGHALAYRTYFALTGVGGGARFTTKSGETTAGVYGFVSVLLRLLENEKPEYLAVSFDTGKTFRDEIFPEYKGTREKMPEDLASQLVRIHELVEAFGIPIYEMEGYEADDVLGAMANGAAAQGVHTIILTGDRDLLQLSTNDITIRLAGQKLSEAIDYGPKEVKKKMGVPPEQVVDYKALVGDSSDNIPGVRGVGDKTATNLLEQYGSLDAIYEHIEEIPTRFSKKLEAGKENAYLSQKLAQIVTDIPLDFDLEACRAQDYDRDKIAALFRELEFRTLINRIPGYDPDSDGAQLSLFKGSVKKATSGKTQDIIVQDKKGLNSLVKKLEKASSIAFDVETTSTDAVTADLVGISLAISPTEGFYIPTGHHPDIAGSKQLDLEIVLEALRKPLTNPKIPKVGHNLKYDFIVLARYGLRATPLTFDTMIAEWLSDPGSRNLGLKNLAWVRLGIEMTEIEELIGRGQNQRTMAQVSIAEVAPYAGADARVCLDLMSQLKNELKEKKLLDLFNDVEMPLISVLADMEMTGILLDTKFLVGFTGKLESRLKKIKSQVYKHVGHEFNINSTQQLSKVLFNELGLSPPDRTRKTASGHYSTAAEVLGNLKDAHPIIQLILEQRELAKLKSTYADALQKQVNPETGRVHTSYNQTGSVTGRIASSDPNLQNIPIRTELGREIRRAFIAESEMLLIGVDYSQIELRIVAHMADDKEMIDAFLADQDIHTTTAAAIYNTKPEKVTSDMRRQAKAVNFGLIYGISPFGLTRTTDLTLAEAEDFVDAYFEQFPGVQRYLEETKQFAAEKGYVETLLGRRRYFPQLVEGGTKVSEIVRSRAEREAINSPIQGSAADVIKIAMLRLPHELFERDLKARMLLQVHDELVLECPQNELDETAQAIVDVMQGAFELKIPLKTDVKVGSNWKEMKVWG